MVEIKTLSMSSSSSIPGILNGAVASAEANNGLSPDLLRIAAIKVDEGPRLKRITQKAMGRGARIVKKTSHITVVVVDAEPEARVKPHGTKAKPRPSFAAAAKAAKKAESKKAKEAEVKAVEAPAETSAPETTEGEGN